MQMIRRVALVAAVCLVAAIQTRQSVLAERNFCTACPVPGVNSQQSTSLGTAHAGGTCSTHQAANGYPLPI